MSPRPRRRGSTVFLSLTLLLVFVGCLLYVSGYVGWAQCLWVLASGTAGAGVMLWVEKHPGD